MRLRSRPIRHSRTTTRSLADNGHLTLRTPAGATRAGRASFRVIGLALLLVTAACSTSEVVTDTADDLDVQGHRGARGLRPENTLPAFEAALDLGVTTLELDLHFSADDRVVVWHDPFVDPSKCRLGESTASGIPDPESAEPSALAVTSLSADQLAGLVCDQNPDPRRFPDQRPDPGDLSGDRYGIVTLEALFEFVFEYSESPSKSDAQRENAAAVLFNIETKREPSEPATIGDGFDGTNPGPFELAILADVESAGLGDRVIVQSFDHRSLRALRQAGSDIALAALTRDSVRDPGQYAEWGASVWSPRASTLTC